MGPRQTAILLMFAAGQACAQPAAMPAPPANGTPANAAPGTVGVAQGVLPDAVRRIFLPPPTQWDDAMLNSHPALQQSPSDFANLTGGVAFGMSPGQVNAKLLDPYAGVSWGELPLASEYPGEVRYLGVPIDRAGALRTGLTSCAGAGSYVVFLFSGNGLFRLSYRLTADKSCAETNEAARAIFARFVPIGDSVALSTRYRTGRTEVVDVTDPTAGYLIPTRWRQSTN
ncbi:MAG: hypothetical protein QOH05_3786 [Acetobacteraceae bacterium]|jgi:hypothetical protein|nr:hypothetical protein [Acetobacteraceae bacterium]